MQNDYNKIMVAIGKKKKEVRGSPKCPKCGSEDFDLLPDAPLLLEQIEFQTE